MALVLLLGLAIAANLCCGWWVVAPLGWFAHGLAPLLGWGLLGVLLLAIAWCCGDEP